MKLGVKPSFHWKINSDNRLVNCTYYPAIHWWNTCALINWKWNLNIVCGAQKICALMRLVHLSGFIDIAVVEVSKCPIINLKEVELAETSFIATRYGCPLPIIMKQFEWKMVTWNHIQLSHAEAFCSTIFYVLDELVEITCAGYSTI